MTQVSIHAAQQGSRINEYVAGALTIALLVLSAVMLFSPLAA
jgi:hypothetical protein